MSQAHGEIIPATVTSAVAVPADTDATELLRYEGFMLGVLAQRGLPGDGVLVSVEQRRRVLSNLDDALEQLPMEHRSRSLYLSKFVMAVGSGLFDAALNYLWDETISELRRRVQLYDLAYFYDLAVTSPDRRKKLQGPDDLVQVQDSELIQACNAMGLVSDVGFRQLDMVRYMRNYASAAHPNQTELTGLQIVGFLETCIREVITLPESSVVAEVKRLLLNVKSTPINPSEAASIGGYFTAMPAAQADNLGQGLFGIYVDLNSTVMIRDNVRLLMPYLWPHLGEPIKQGFGLRYGRFVANHDQQQVTLTRELLDTVDAASYLPENVRVAEIDEAVDALLLAHHGLNNFYTEPALAARLQSLIGTNGVPELVRAKYVTAVTVVFLGRRSGVAWSADPIYRQLIQNFTTAEAAISLLAYDNIEISSKLQHPGPAGKYAELLDILDPKLVSRNLRDLLVAIRRFTGPRESMRMDSGLQRLAKAAR